MPLPLTRLLLAVLLSAPALGEPANPLLAGDCAAQCQWDGFTRDFRERADSALTLSEAALVAFEQLADEEVQAQGFRALDATTRSTLPEVVVLGWDLLGGRVPAVSLPTDRVARLPEGDLDVLAGLYTRALPDLRLALVLLPVEPRIRHPDYPAWKLAAGAADSRHTLFMRLAACSAPDGPECPTLPPGLVITPDETRQWWPLLAPGVRAEVLARTRGEGTAELASALLRHADPGAAAVCWEALLGDSEARTALALVLLSQLLDGPSALPELYRSVPKPTSPYRAGRVHRGATSEAALHLLADGARTHLTLWQQLAVHENPWVASLGMAGLVAAGEGDAADRTMATAGVPREIIDRMVLDLVHRQDGDPIDAYVLARARVARDPAEACRIIDGMSRARRERLMPALVPWALQRLGRPPLDDALPIESLPERPDNRVLDEASGHAICLLEVLPPPHEADPGTPGYREIARMLAASPAEIRQLVGAVMLARAGEPEAARRVHARLIGRAPFPAQAAIVAVLEQQIRAAP